MDESGEKEMKLQKKCGKRKKREAVVGASGKTSKPLPMDESGEKIIKLMSLKKCVKRKKRESVVVSCKTSNGEKEMKLQILLQSLKDLLSEYADCGVAGRTIVNGCDTKLLEYVVETALTNFASPSQKEEEEAVVASFKTRKPLPGEKEMKLKKCGKKKKREEAVSAWITSNPFPIDESIVKEMKELKEIDDVGYALPGCREVGRIVVRGYDTTLPQDVVERAFINHFSQCGRITDVYVPKRSRPTGTKILSDYSLIYFVGKGAVENALRLDGTNIGGGTVTIKSYPFPPNANSTLSLTVKGFDASLSEMVIERDLIKIFSSCGEVYSVYVFKNGSADFTVKGEDAAEKVQKLNGSCFMGHHKLVVRNIYYPKIRIFHPRRSYC